MVCCQPDVVYVVVAVCLDPADSRDKRKADDDGAQSDPGALYLSSIHDRIVLEKWAKHY
jgi:hypothetical protein